MKTIRFSILAGLGLLATFLPSAYGNHRTGDLALPELLVPGDFNEDGKLDLAVNVSGFDNVAILIGDGQGGLTLSGRVKTDTLPKGLAVGDVSRDGHLDLVGCTNWGYDVEIHLGDGVGGFGQRDNLVKAEGGPSRVLLADFNRDRALDLAVNGPDEGVILVYLGNGRGGFKLPPEEIEDIPRNYGITTADFNGDGNPDIAATTIVGKGPTGTHVDVFLGDGTGSFAMSAELAANPQASALGTGDLNNDGKVDLVAAGAGPENATGNFISTYLGDGTGNFTLKETTLLGTGAIKGEIAVGDFNEDGILDVAYPVTSLQVSPGHQVLIFFGDGSGKLVPGPTVTVGVEPHTVIANDFNKDGHLDLAVSNRTDATVSVFLGNGSGTFTLSTTVSVVCEGGVCN